MNENGRSWGRKDIVERARIMVVGCGALGNEVIKDLVLFGVRHLVVVDDDIGAECNLARSVLYAPADVGRSKVRAVARRVGEMNPQAEVDTIDGDVAVSVGLGLLRSMDVVIGCLDNRLARYRLNRLCMRAGVPWVDGGIDGLEGTARVFAPGQNCYACNLGPEALRDLGRHLSCADVVRRNERSRRAATTPIMAAIIGAVQVQEALKLLHPDEMSQGDLTSLCGKMFYYEGQHLGARFVTYQAYDDECECHERWEPVKASPMTTQTTVAAALARLKGMAECDTPVIVLRNHRFVDYVVSRRDDHRTDVMAPDFRVPDMLERDGHTDTDMGAYLQHGYGEIGDSFPYSHLTLAQVGVPRQDVLCVRAGEKEIFVELASERLTA